MTRSRVFPATVKALKCASLLARITLCVVLVSRSCWNEGSYAVVFRPECRLAVESCGVVKYSSTH